MSGDPRRTAVTELSTGELTATIQELGGKPFHARQLERWVYVRGAASFEACTDLPKNVRASLSERLEVLTSHVVQSEVATDGTTKLLIALADAETIEVVLIPETNRTTLCISTQVGCPVACIFCASGLDGVRRNLSAIEITEQVLHGIHALREQDPERHLSNLVVMGIGEPMLNLDNLLLALERIHDPHGIGLGARRITVSTSGYPDRIRKFAKAPHAFNLAISLHAADEELRKRLVPTARSSVKEIVGAARYYFETTGRQVTFEVVLLAGINDRPADVDTLAQRLRGFPCTVNVLPWNPVEQIREISRPSPRHVDAFVARLRELGINTTVRKQRGADRSAACGQLRISAASS